MSIRSVVLLAAVLCALPLSGAAAQQATDSESQPVSALTESVNVPADLLPAPTSLVLLPDEPLPSSRFTLAPALAAPPAAGQHTIVISTLSLVLAIILLVVLID